ncbi:MAG: hypothetical protein U5L00_21230 [Desulfovermiculus sp.]|nr:hypothetical protein [Desulfovermiculus sp.]
MAKDQYPELELIRISTVDTKVQKEAQPDGSLNTMSIFPQG